MLVFGEGPIMFAKQLCIWINQCHWPCHPDSHFLYDHDVERRSGRKWKFREIFKDFGISLRSFSSDFFRNLWSQSGRWSASRKDCEYMGVKTPSALSEQLYLYVCNNHHYRYWKIPQFGIRIQILKENVDYAGLRRHYRDFHLLQHQVSRCGMQVQSHNEDLDPKLGDLIAIRNYDNDDN